MSATTVLATMLTTTIAKATPTAVVVPNQAGVIEGLDPTHYNPKNPLVLFIIQVRLPAPVCMIHLKSDRDSDGHYHRHMSIAALAPFICSAAYSYRRGYRRNCTWYVHAQIRKSRVRAISNNAQAQP